MNIIAIVVSVVMVFFGFAGGGGSSSGGGGGGGSSYSSYSSSSSSSSGDGEFTPFDAVLVIGFIVAVIIAMFFSSKKLPGHKDYNSTEAEKRIHEDAERIFKNYQADWSEFRLDDIRTFTTRRYYEHASLMLELLKNMHRANKVSKLKVHKVYLLTPINEETDLPVNVRVTFVFSGLDEVIEDGGRKLYSEYVSNVSETWNFIYDGQTLKLDGISQPTESAPHLVKSLAKFAAQNNLFYSPDWGRYCLPARGLIFGGASMKIADINNHVIGKWVISSFNYILTPKRQVSTSLVIILLVRSMSLRIIWE